jgi:outer membrane receptor protein involved in Fe transport
VGNPNLQWETNAKYDVGVDMQLFNGRMSLTADWFKNDINNIVLRVPTPPSAGVPGNAISQNIGTMENKGIELSLGYNVINKKDFSWDVNFNYSNVQNKVTKLYNVGGVPVPFIDGAYNIIKVGEPINIIYGYEYAGVNSANGNPMYYKADGSLIQMNLSAAGVIGAYYYALSKNDPNLGVRTTLSTDDRKN